LIKIILENDCGVTKGMGYVRQTKERIIASQEDITCDFLRVVCYQHSV
jgi:hypothetical protein